MARHSTSHSRHRSNGRSRHRTPTRPSVAEQQWHHLRATAACGALSLITGAAVGAILMYAFDPKTGRQRRQYAYDAARDAARGALDSATDVLGHAYHHAGDAAAGALGYAADHLRSQDTAAATFDAGQHLFDRAAGAAASYRDAASRRAHAWLDSARGMIPHRRRPTDVSAWSAGAVALAAVAAGMGAMWLFDPSRGRGRRAWIVQKGNRVVNETGYFMRATGRHLRNKATGYAHLAGSMISDTDLAEHAHAALEKLGDYASAIKVAAENGYIRLTGHAPTDIVDDVLHALHNVKGVLGIENDLEVTDIHSSTLSQMKSETSNPSA